MAPGDISAQKKRQKFIKYKNKSVEITNSCRQKSLKISFYSLSLFSIHHCISTNRYLHIYLSSIYIYLGPFLCLNHNLFVFGDWNSCNFSMIFSFQNENKFQNALFSKVWPWWLFLVSDNIIFYFSRTTCCQWVIQ